ncbi:MAG: 16S rRNA (guanine(527)-N(7))-methyltransferase RsmG, partial [Clostridium sp.]
GKLLDVKEIVVEGTDLNHNLVIVEKIKSCPKTYPRKAGNVTKKPL